MRTVVTPHIETSFINKELNNQKTHSGPTVSLRDTVTWHPALQTKPRAQDNRRGTFVQTGVRKLATPSFDSPDASSVKTC